MKRIEEKALRNVLTVLDSIGATYKIVDRDGHVYSTLSAAPSPEYVSRQSRVHLYEEHLKGLNVGDVATVPASDEVTVGNLQALCSAYMKRTFGANSYESSRNPDGSIDIMRIS